MIGYNVVKILKAIHIVLLKNQIFHKLIMNQIVLTKKTETDEQTRIILIG